MENKKQELNEQELEAINGGATYTYEFEGTDMHIRFMFEAGDTSNLMAVLASAKKALEEKGLDYNKFVGPISGQAMSFLPGIMDGSIKGFDICVTNVNEAEGTADLKSITAIN